MKLEQPVTILLRRQGARGDVLLATGVVRELYQKYQGQCQIDVATDFADVFTDNPYVNCVHATAEIPDVDYDVVINLDNSYERNPGDSIVDNYNMRAFGTVNVNGEAELFLSDAGHRAIADIVQNKIAADFICIHMRNWHWQMKNIVPEVWMTVISKILDQRPDFKIVCVGGETDYYPAGHPRILDARGLSMQNLSCLLDHAKCFVGIDSAPFHVAGTSQTHIVALLSHMNPATVLPVRNGQLGHNCTVIQAKVSCCGCHSRQPRPVSKISCEQPASDQFLCNRAWDTDEIAAAIIKQL
jgi:ADP-heptose:LPS heptosyltransferase